MSGLATAAEKFVEKAGQKDTSVHEHYHTSVLPIKEVEVLPEKHEHVVHDIKHHEHKHGDAGLLKRLLAEEKEKFKDLKTEAEAIITHKEATAVKGEHVHHHVHETIQPVIQKEVIVPTVIHTTIPVREVHHNEAKHHAATTLPPVSLEEFQKQGGSLSGREVRTENFAGEPRAAGEAASKVAAGGATANVAASTATANANVAASTPAADANMAAKMSSANEPLPAKPLARSPTGPSLPRKNTMKESSQGAKEV
ncbi:hypothetical protein MMC10_005328 [Thelotrema lepadinum]|nr:hypothetical protein [Thelotrema lepadinum]